MTQIEVLQFRPTTTDEILWSIVNTMAIDYLQFAIQTHYYARLFGVLNSADEGGDYGDFVANQCLREAIWSTLFQVQEHTENAVGYNLSPRFHKATISVTSLDKRWQTNWPGISKVDVVEEWTVLDDYTDVEISPYILTGLTTTIDNGQTVVALDTSVVDNPHNIILRLSSDNSQLQVMPSGTAGFPKRSGTNWLVAINTNATPVAGEISVQHKNYVFVDVTPPTTEDCSGEFVPVYENTNQRIPLAKATETLPGGDKRFWFYIYTLVNPAFYTDTVDLQNGEFYKLHQTIQFKCYREAPQKARLIQRPMNSDCRNNCEEKTFQISTYIVNRERGLVRFECDGELVIEDDEEVLYENRKVIFSPYCEYFLTYYYKTHPDELYTSAKKDIPKLFRAVVHKVAADLPVKDCGCNMVVRHEERGVQVGFIAEQQKTYSTVVNTPSGGQIVHYKYGELHGHRVYQDLLSAAYVYKVRII